MSLTDPAHFLEACSAVLAAARTLRPDNHGPPLWWTTFLVPAVSALLAVAGAWVAIAFDRRKSTNQELIKKRIEVFDYMAPKLNDLLCFAVSVGSWRTLTPTSVITHKRELDRSFHIYRAMFSLPFAAAYTRLIEECYFSTWQGPGAPARLKLSTTELKIQWGAHWDSQWDAHFVPPDTASPQRQIVTAYADLMHQFTIEVGGRSAAWAWRGARAQARRGFPNKPPC